jgi:hypothetical protein
MNKNSTYWLCVLVLAQFSLAEVTLEDIVDGIEVRQDLIKSVKLDFDYQYFQPNEKSLTGEDTDYQLEVKKVIDYSYETLRQSKKVRVKQIEKDIKTEKDIKSELVAWDGKVRTAYVEDLTRPESKPGGTIINEMGSFYSGYWPTAMEMWVFDMRESLSDILQKSTLELNGPEKVVDHEAIKLTAKNFFGENAVLEAWIVPQKDFAPVKLRLVYHIQGHDDIILTMDNVELENKGGVWVIMESSIKVVNPNLPQKLHGEICCYKARDYQVDFPIDEKMFKINFPNGTQVYDGILQTGYIMGEGIFVGDTKGGGKYVPFEIPSDLDNVPSPVPPVSVAEKIIEETVSTKNIEADSEDVTDTDQKKLQLIYFGIPIFIVTMCIAILFFITQTKRGENE